MPVHPWGALELAKLEAALRFLRRVADQVDTADPPWQARVQPGSVREYLHPRCTCVSDLGCLDVTDPFTEGYILS
jgi:hypothetical protein